LDLRDYRTEIFDDLVLQSCGPDRSSAEHARRGGTAHYAWLYPNLMINCYGDVMDVNIVEPIGPGRTRVTFDFYYPSHATTDEIREGIAVSETIQREDIALCESVQRGLHSPHFDTGRYAPALEIGEHVFHRRLHADFLAALTRQRP